MGNLVLDSLEIRGFRGFQHLQIEKLGRVNLIVGKNNVGKSSLLEALQIYAKRGDPTLIRNFLRSRDENRLMHSDLYINSEIEVRENLLLSLRYLFYGRNIISHFTEPIKIGAINSPESRLSIAIKWYALTGADEQGLLKRVEISPEDANSTENASPRFAVQFDHNSEVNYAINEDRAITERVITEWKEINSIYAKTNFLTKQEIGRLWDNITLTGLDHEVLNGLLIIAPSVEGLNLVDDLGTKKRERIPVVKIAGIDERLPLGHLGDGMQRMLSITLALVNSRDGILLIDEIENGLHYLVQPDLWRLVFKLAQRLNVQVFATTHSWDCIEAFQKAAQADEQVEGMLISLEKGKSDIEAVLYSDIEAVLYNEEELKIVTRERIEVR